MSSKLSLKEELFNFFHSRNIHHSSSLNVIKFIKTVSSQIHFSSSHHGAAHRQAQPAGDDELRLCRVHQPEEVGHLKLGVGQRNRLFEELNRSLQISPLDFDRSQRFVGELALVVDLDGALDVLGGLCDVALPLELDEAAVDEDVGVVRVDLNGAIVVRIGLFKLLLIAQNLKESLKSLSNVFLASFKMLY